MSVNLSTSILRILSPTSFRSSFESYSLCKSLFIYCFFLCVLYMDLIIAACLTPFSTNRYISIVAWRYGTHHTYKIHATYCNPWIYMIAGSIMFTIGCLLPPQLSIYTSRFDGNVASYSQCHFILFVIFCSFILNT
jgi:hypothetical protein